MCVERCAESVKQIAKPPGIFFAGAIQTEALQAHWYHPRIYKTTVLRIDLCQIDSGQIAAKCLISADPFVVVQEIAAAVKYQMTVMNLCGLRVM